MSGVQTRKMTNAMRAVDGVGVQPDDRNRSSSSLSTEQGASGDNPTSMAGGHVSDHSNRIQSSGVREVNTSTGTVSKARSRTSSSRASRATHIERDLLRRTAELEAAQELARLKTQELLVKKRLALKMVEIDAEEEQEIEESEVDSTERVEQWFEQSTPARVLTPITSHPNMVQATATPPVYELNQTPRAPTMEMSAFPRTRETELRTRETAKECKSDIKELAEEIKKLSQPRSIPQQMYRLPDFNGNPTDWLLFQKAYRQSSSAYSFTSYENLARIQAALHGDAKTMVEDLLRTSTDPEEIIYALDNAFGNPKALLHCALQKVKALPTISESGRELHQFAAVVRNCVSLLRNIHADGYINNPQLCEEIIDKLTPFQRAQYGAFAMKVQREYSADLRISPNLNALVDFLTHLARESEYYTKTDFSAGTKGAPANESHVNKAKVAQRVHAQAEVGNKTDNKNNTHSDKNVDNKNKVNCVMCNSDHKLTQCGKFKNLSVDERWNFVKDNKLCFKCILKSHSRNFCRAKRCDTCKWSHHTLLHSEKPATSPPTPPNSEAVTNVGQCSAKALLKVIPILIRTDNGEERSTYALLDDGATVSILDSSFASACDGPIAPLKIVTARGHIVTDDTSRRVNIEVCGPNGQYHKVSVRTMRDLDLPPQTVPARVFTDNEHLRELMNCTEMEDAKPMLLLGQDNWELIVSRDIRKGKSGRPVASFTNLGWVVHGPLGASGVSNECVNLNVLQPELHDLVKSQFELEAIGISHMSRKNNEVERANRLLENTSRRVEHGWEVGLLWKSDNVELPDNYSYARKRLGGIERRMDSDSAYADLYNEQINRLISEKFARKLEHGLEASPVWYLPHFGVVNPNKPGKLRLVFDAAAVCKGTSLNDNLLTGPDMLNSLLGVLFRFRTGRVAFTADIADMFMRIQIREADQGAQLFLWRGQDRNRDPDIYAMNSMIFGAASSPTSAIYILNKNAEEFQDSYPEAVKAIFEKHYMDDYIDSVDTVEQAEKLIADVARIHAAGDFNIRGWTTNSPDLRARLPAVVPGRVQLDKSPSCTERTLGMIWNPESDNLAFDLSFKRLPVDIVEGRATPTKREFLRFIMSVFDPLGFLYPCVIQSRIIMRRVWQSGIQWDEQLKDPEAALWFKWLQSLTSLGEVSISRWYGIGREEVELHVFGDASEQAYAAVAYIVGRTESGEGAVAFVAGKARVAPLKIVSIPRLELQAAVLACRLATTVKKEVNVPINKQYMWTDSKTVLKWINSDARDFQKYVSHRLAEIDNMTKTSDWRWVPSAENPADEATKMNWPNTSDLWLSGPSFLYNPQNQWPVSERTEESDHDPERIERVHVAAGTNPSLLDGARYSTWTRAQRVMARVLAFIGTCRRRQTAALTAGNLRDAEAYLLRQAQAQAFPRELGALRAGRALPCGSKLSPLDPMLYEDGLLRVRGRLSAAPGLCFDEKHPIILDGRDHFTRLLVGAYHQRSLHANHETVVNNVRERFWVLQLRPTVKTVVANCQLCRIRRAQPCTPKMSDLPVTRLETTRRAFVHCGLDYFGPMEVTIGRRREKRWGVLFTCLATRAVHLELAASLNADSAILALRRLIARRGQPAMIKTDRGTNFVGAKKELRAALRGLDEHHLRDEATARGIEWRFNPPAAPHMGGAWERLVRSVKNALRATLREKAPKEEVLHTLLLEAELVVNSRPLTYVASDPDQPTVLTPNHLLLGTASGSTPTVPWAPTDIDARRQWIKANALAEIFWKRWTREYLPTLQRRQKWTNAISPVKIGDLVLVVDGNNPRSVWPRVIISAVHTGSDGTVRVVDVKTAQGSLRRPVVKVVVLPVNGNVLD